MLKSISAEETSYSTPYDHTFWPQTCMFIKHPSFRGQRTWALGLALSCGLLVLCWLMWAKWRQSALFSPELWHIYICIFPPSSQCLYSMQLAPVFMTAWLYSVFCKNVVINIFCWKLHVTSSSQRLRVNFNSVYKFHIGALTKLKVLKNADDIHSISSGRFWIKE